MRCIITWSFCLRRLHLTGPLTVATMCAQMPGVVLRRISAAAAEALRARRTPEDVRVAADYPTEFSFGVGQHAGSGAALGPFFLHQVEDDVVVGEIGGGQVAPGVVEIGYAVVASRWGRGYATEAVR